MDENPNKNQQSTVIEMASPPYKNCRLYYRRFPLYSTYRCSMSREVGLHVFTSRIRPKFRQPKFYVSVSISFHVSTSRISHRIMQWVEEHTIRLSTCNRKILSWRISTEEIMKLFTVILTWIIAATLGNFCDDLPA